MHIFPLKYLNYRLKVRTICFRTTFHYLICNNVKNIYESLEIGWIVFTNNRKKKKSGRRAKSQFEFFRHFKLRNFDFIFSRSVAWECARARSTSLCACQFRSQLMWHFFLYLPKWARSLKYQVILSSLKLNCFFMLVESRRPDHFVMGCAKFLAQIDSRAHWQTLQLWNSMWA